MWHSWHDDPADDGKEPRHRFIDRRSAELQEDHPEYSRYHCRTLATKEWDNAEEDAACFANSTD